MLPQDPRLRGRLLRAARVLLDWSQARLACEVRVSTAAVHAVEAGRLGARCAAATAMVRALEAAGVRFLAAAEGGSGPGLRYTSCPRDRPGATVVRLVRPDPPRPATPPPAAGRSPGGPPDGGAAPCRVAAAERRVARQRALLARLAAAGHRAPAGHALLAAMEDSLALLRQSRGPVGPAAEAAGTTDVAGVRRAVAGR
jgi:DNA-binding XRE family transcriptional regulator